VVSVIAICPAPRRPGYVTKCWTSQPATGVATPFASRRSTADTVSGRPSRDVTETSQPGISTTPCDGLTASNWNTLSPALTWPPPSVVMHTIYRLSLFLQIARSPKLRPKRTRWLSSVAFIKKLPSPDIVERTTPQSPLAGWQPGRLGLQQRGTIAAWCSGRMAHRRLRWQDVGANSDYSGRAQDYD